LERANKGGNETPSTPKAATGKRSKPPLRLKTVVALDRLHPDRRLPRFDPPENASDMRKLLAHLTIEVREGRINPQLAVRIAFIAGVFLRSSEIEELREVRAEMAELKRRFEEQEQAKKRARI